MAERRMLAKTIIESDAFIDMPLSAQALYMHLNEGADDEGFINSAKKIQRMIGAKDRDMEELEKRKFILSFPSGIKVIKHWWIHNYIPKDRLHETKYKDEKARLELDENKAYRFCIQDVYKTETEVRIGKVRIGKDSKKEYGELANVRLTDEEKQKLIEKMGLQNFETYVASLDLWIAQKGNKYKSHYATILNWYRRDGEKRQDILPTYTSTQDYGTDEEIAEKVRRIRDGLTH